MNLCEIGLFHIVCGVSKGTRDNYHEIGENNVLGPKYIYISVSKMEEVQEHDLY